MIARLCSTLSLWASEARAAQLDALRELQASDSVVGSFDVQDVAEGCAEEGAQPPVTTGAGLTPEQWLALVDSQADDWWLDMLMPTVLVGCAVAYAARHFGWI